MKRPVNRGARLAGWLWAAIVLYPVTQAAVAMGWTLVPYSWRYDYISSLGNTACGVWDGRFICSPLYPLMNTGFVVTGLLMLVGGLLFARAYRRQRRMVIGFGLQALGGIGAIVVGLVPENSGSLWHGIGAALPFLGGNAGLLLIALGAARWPKWLRGYTFASGLIGLAGLGLFMAGQDFGLGRGGMERIVDGAHTLWMIMFGLLAVYEARALGLLPGKRAGRRARGGGRPAPRKNRPRA